MKTGRFSIKDTIELQLVASPFANKIGFSWQIFDQMENISITQKEKKLLLNGKKRS